MRDGLLSVSGRQAAVRASLPLLATWFGTGQPDELVGSTALGFGEDAIDEAFLWALKLRTALAQARRLDDVLRAVAVHPSFRYTRVNDVVVGAVKGRLDLERYLKERARRDVPQRYPVRVVQRSLATPENALLMFAIATVAETLRDAPSYGLPQDSVEGIELADRLSSLTRATHNPLFAEALRDAAAVARRGTIDELIEDVDHRLDSARVANVGAYRLLLDVVTEIVRPFDGAGSDVDWLGRDDRFDTRLYEIWTLQRTFEALTRSLGPPTDGPHPLLKPKRGEHATATWAVGTGSISVHFQRSLRSLRRGSPAVWTYRNPDAELLGFPDVVCAFDAGALGAAAVLIDAKLRQRSSPPSEELYKILGYFENLPNLAHPAGAIVYYSPGDVRLRHVERAGGGKVLLLGADPELTTESDAAFDALADLVIDVADHSAPDTRRTIAQIATRGRSEETTAAIQEAAVRALAAEAERLPEGALDAELRRLAADLGPAWEPLNDEIRRMFATAVHFGFRAQPDFDHRGPLLGLCAPCEAVLAAHVMRPMREALGPQIKFTTLGAAARWTRLAAAPESPFDQRVREWVLDPARPFDGAKVVELAPLLREVATDRNDAAHTALISSERFDRGHQRILGQSGGLLVRLMAALRLTLAPHETVAPPTSSGVPAGTDRGPGYRR